MFLCLGLCLYLLRLRLLEVEEQRKLLAAAKDHNAEYDLLSRLPEPLIHRVISFLSLKEVVKASVVCKSWGRICSSFPVLDFRFHEFVGEASGRDGVERMARFGDATMTRFQEQHMKIDKFRITCRLFWEPKDVWQSRIEKWTAIALDNNAREISIHGLGAWGNHMPEPPSLDLGALSGSTKLTSLRSLTLDGFKAGEFLSWGRLMSACVSLESLSLSRCCLEAVRISGLPNLKKLSIAGCSTCMRIFEIEAPSLERFSLYVGKHAHPCVVNVNHCPNLKSLTLQNVAENDGWFRDLLSRFQRLRDLTICYCKSLSRIRISNPLIENIKIVGCNNLTDISMEAPQLRWLRHKPVAEVAVLFTKQVEWSSKLREFLVGSCKSFSSLHFRVHTRDYVLELRNDIKHGWLGVMSCNLEQLSLARRRATREALPRAVDLFSNEAIALAAASHIENTD